MAQLPPIPVCILAAGTSRRFGTNKALAKLGDKAMIEHVIDRITPQTGAPIAINANAYDGMAAFGHPIVLDTIWAGSGPLSGIMSALQWARELGSKRIVTVAVDIPFLPLDLVAKLCAIDGSAIASANGQLHPVNAIWEIDRYDALDAYLGSGKRSLHGWAEECEANLVCFDDGPGPLDPFWNVNTPEDMARAEAMLKNN